MSLQFRKLSSTESLYLWWSPHQVKWDVHTQTKHQLCLFTSNRGQSNGQLLSVVLVPNRGTLRFAVRRTVVEKLGEDLIVVAVSHTH